MLVTTYFQVSFQGLCGEPSPIITQRIQEDDMYDVIIESPYYDPYYRLPLGGGWTQGYVFFFCWGSACSRSKSGHVADCRCLSRDAGTQGLAFEVVSLERSEELLLRNLI